MNCLRMSPGTVRKPGAIVRKCLAQALKSILDGRRYWTIAVIIGRSSLRIASGDLSIWFAIVEAVADTNRDGESVRAVSRVSIMHEPEQPVSASSALFFGLIPKFLI